MKTKNLIVWAIAAAVLGVAAFYCGSGRKLRTPSVNGKPVVGEFDLSDVAKVEIDGSKKLVLVAAEDGWKIDTFYGYPADTGKIRENLLKLSEAKVGQVAKGIEIALPTTVEVSNAGGTILATATLGEKHLAKPKGEMAMYGGYPDGRYMKYGDRTVLVKEPLEAFDGDPMSWCDAKLCDTPYVRFTGLVDPSKEAEYGFATGTVCTVTYKGVTNTLAKVGGTVAGGSDRYFKIESEKWVFTIPSYTADSLAKPKEEPKAKDEVKAE